MSRLMGFIHDRVEAAGHEIDYLCADDVPPAWAGWFGRRIAFPLAVRSRAVEADRVGRPYDIVNVHEPSAAAVLIGRRGARAPAVVVTSHGLERRAWELAKEEGRLGREAPGWRTRMTYPVSGLWPGELALRRADHVFCLNEEDRNMLVQEFGRSPQTITRVVPGADEVYAQAADARDYARGGRVLFAGTWRKNKGVEDLVPAFVALAERHAEMTLHVVGAGVPEETVRARFPESIRARILCETPQDDDAMAAAFSNADVFLLPSLFEGTPLTLIQAMMSGLPIVTTFTCGMKDVIADLQTGLLVPIRSPQALVAAVERVASDGALRARLGTAARAAALRRYTWDQAAEPVLRAYEALQ
jgi:glycosyltransferase involved in cell wall biosynthesis